MKTRFIYSMLLAVALTAGISSCSNNDDPSLKPTSNTRSLTLDVEGKTVSDNGTDLSISLNLDAVSRVIPVEVKSNTLWKVVVSRNSGWCTLSVAEGKGNGAFTITVLTNRSEDRSCKISVYQVDGSGEAYKDGNTTDIEISQIGSEVYITPSSLEMFPAENAREQTFEIVSNVSWTLSVRYETGLTSNFVSVIPGEGMSETELSDGAKQYSGNSDAAFKISLQDNHTAIVRKAYIELKSESGNYSVEISQQKSEYTFDVSPSETRYVDPSGQELEFSVYSPNDGWTVTADPWIVCPNTHFEKNNDWVTVTLNVKPNDQGRIRSGMVYFISDDSGNEKFPVEVVQNGFDLAFTASLANGEDPVTAAGGVLTYSLDSRFDWEISAPDWVNVTPSKGKASEQRQTVEINVDVNNSYSSRFDSIYFNPIPTDFKGVGTLKPSDVGVHTIRFFIEQDGGKKAAISIPWIGEVYENNRVSIDYNFYSPYYDVEVAGIKWKKADAQEWENELTLKPSDPKSATVSFLLEGLRNLTTYVAQGYIKCSNGDTIEGNICEPFTTAGNYPSLDDNPAPEK